MKNEIAFYANLIMANVWMASGHSDHRVWAAVFLILAALTQIYTYPKKP